MADILTLQTAMHEQGRKDALELQEAAPNMSGTEIVAEHTKIPQWRMGEWPTGRLCWWGDPTHIFRAMAPGHDSTGNPLWTPDEAALFEVVHTTDPALASDWRDPYGTSGLWYKNECYKGKNGVVYRQTYDGPNNFDAEAMPDRWEIAII